MELVLEYRVIVFGTDYLRKVLTAVSINGTKLQLSRGEIIRFIFYKDNENGAQFFS